MYVCSINFGGGGIYGACRNIDISEIHGYATVRAEIGSPATASSPERPARLIIQLEGARGGSASQQQQRSQAGRGTGAATSAPGPAAAAATAPARAEVVDNGQQRSSSSQPATVAPVRPHSFTEPTQEATRDAAAVTARLQQTSMQPNGSAQHDIVHKPSRLQEATSSRSLYPSACSTSSMSGLAPRPAARLPSQTEQPAPLGRLSPHAAPPLPQLTGNKSGKSGNVAMRFLRSIGSKKDKYQGKERGQVQPQPGDDLEAGSKKNLRTLASKLLHRKSSRPHEGEGRGGLGRLEFGGNALGGTHRSRSRCCQGPAELTDGCWCMVGHTACDALCINLSPILGSINLMALCNPCSILNGSVDEDASVHFSESNVGEALEAGASMPAGVPVAEFALWPEIWEQWSCRNLVATWLRPELPGSLLPAPILLLLLLLLLTDQMCCAAAACCGNLVQMTSLTLLRRMMPAWRLRRARPLSFWRATGPWPPRRRSRRRLGAPLGQGHCPMPS